MHSCNCICGTTDQFCYGNLTSAVFHGLFSVSNVVEAGTLLYARAHIVVTASNYGVETEALFEDPRNHQLDCW